MKRYQYLSMSHKDTWALNVTKAFINAKKVNSAKFRSKAHFMSYGYWAQIFISETLSPFLLHDSMQLMSGKRCTGNVHGEQI